jgi:uncharacterized membrane protein
MTYSLSSKLFITKELFIILLTTLAIPTHSMVHTKIFLEYRNTTNAILVLIGCALMIIFALCGIAWNTCSIVISPLNKAPRWVFILGYVVHGVFTGTAVLGIMSVLFFKIYHARKVLTILYIIGIISCLILEIVWLCLSIYVAVVTVYSLDPNTNSAYRMTQVILLCVAMPVVLVCSGHYLRYAMRQYQVSPRELLATEDDISSAA